MSTTGVSFTGKAGEKTRDHGSAFGIAIVRSSGIVNGTKPRSVMKVRWGYRRGNNLVESSAGASVRAIALGS